MPQRRAPSCLTVATSTTALRARSRGSSGSCRSRRWRPAVSRVRDLVGRGRTPYLRPLRPWSDGDTDAVTEALRATGLIGLSDRRLTRSPVVSASARGLRSRSRSAPSCCCSTSQPRSSTSPTNTRYLTSLHGLAQDGRTIVVVLHDLAQAARYADHLVLMSAGLILARGVPY